METERELALNRERIVALEQKFFELGNRPPVIAAVLPPIANSVSELQNVSGVSTGGTNSNSAAAVSATSALLRMSTSTPPNLPVSGAFDPDIDELMLSQFHVVNVDEFKQPSTFDNEIFTAWQLTSETWRTASLTSLSSMLSWCRPQL